MPEESMYPAADEEQSSTPENKSGDEKETEGETALIPKSLLAGKEFNPGDEVILKIVHMYEDEVEVQYSSGKDSEGEKSPEMNSAMSKLDEMPGA